MTDAPRPEDTAERMSDILKPAQVAEYFQVAPRTVLEWLRDGTVFPHAFKIGIQWRVPLDDVHAHAASLRGDTTGDRSPVTWRGSKRYKK